MHLQPADIIKRVERNGGKTVWLAERLLLQVIPDLDEEYFRTHARDRYRATVSDKKRQKDILPDTGKSWRYGKINGSWYYALANIPDKAPANYRSKLPPIEELKKQVKTAPRKEEQHELEAYLKAALSSRKNAFYRAYAGLKSEQSEGLASACALAEGLINWAAERGHNLNKVAFLNDAAAVLQKIGPRYLPCNWKKLGEKLRECAENGIEMTIKLPRAGNNNSLKFDDPEIRAWMIQMRGMGQNYSGAHIARKLRLMCELTGKPVPSTRWFESELAQPSVKFLTAAGRYGERGRKGGMFRSYVPVEKALFAGDCWQMDGTRVNFLPWRGADGREESLFQIVVRDVHSGDILGIHYCKTEDRWGYIMALKMAVNRAGYLPYQLVLDRFPGHNTAEWKAVQTRIERLGVLVDYKHTAQGKAQLERWFETLQSVFLMESPWYYGEGIMSRRDSAHRSAEYLKAQSKERGAADWGFDRAWKEATACLDRYRNTKLSEYSRAQSTVTRSPRELHDESEKPHIKTVPTADFILLFGHETEVTLRGSSLKMQVNRVDYIYMIEDYEVVKNWRKVRVQYDVEDLTKVWLFEPGGAGEPRFLCEATEVRATQMFGPNADMKSLGQQKRRIADIKQQAVAEFESMKSAGSDVTLLLHGLAPKAEQETAESRYLMERVLEWKPDGKPRILRAEEKPVEEDDDEFLKTDSTRTIAAMAWSQY